MEVKTSDMKGLKGKYLFAAVFMLVFCTVIYPLPQASGYLVEDSFASVWAEQSASYKNQRGSDSRARELIYYEVCRGDTLWGLAAVWGTEMDAIAAVNGLDKDAALYAGQMLVLPVKRSITHEVERGDTLWSLARRYGISLNRLMKLNGIDKPGLLPVGKELIIPFAGSDGAMSASVIGEQHLAVERSSRLFWPVLGEITSLYGPREDEFHHGIDIAGDFGDPVRAAQSGQVIFVGWRPIYGNTVIVDHGSGLRTLYGHLEDFLVKKDDYVKKGEVIAHIGSTGRATGPHLHLELRVNNRAINPLPYLSLEKY